MGKINSLSHNKTLFFWLFAIIVLTLYNLTPALGSFDTRYYLIAGEHFLNGEIDCLRTPLYPLLLKSSYNLFGAKGMCSAVTILQSIVYLISLISLLHLAEKTIVNTTIRFVILIFYVSCIAPGWCNELTTESLSISGCVILADLVVSMLHKPTILKNILSHFILILLVFLRPTFIIFFAILPFIWLYQIFKTSHRAIYSIAFALTLLCILCYAGYAKLYEKQYNHFGVSATFVFNKIYDAHRGGYWDVNAVNNPDARRWIDIVDKHYNGNYAPTYRIITLYPESLTLINQGCDEIINAHRKEHKRYRFILLAGSFNTRLQAAVNTHTPLSAVLFATSLFLSFPVSLFYLFTLIATFATIIRFLQSKRLPLIFFFLNAIVLAQTIGIILTTSDAHERVLLPVYPIFLIILGIGLDFVAQRFVYYRQ